MMYKSIWGNVVVFTKDIGPARIIATIIKQMQCTDPIIVAEAASIGAWQDAGFTISRLGPEKFDPNNRWDFDVEDLLYRVKPKIVIVGLSWPIHLEAKAIVEARKKGIYTIAIVDNWGAHCRAPMADMYLSIDPLAAKLVEKSYSAIHTGMRVVVTGDRAASDEVDADPVLVDIIDQLQNRGKVVMWASQKWSESIESLKLACDSLAQSHAAGHRFTLVPRIHPGASDADKNLWTEVINKYRAIFPVSWIEKDFFVKAVSSDDIAKRAHCTFAVTGTALRASAYSRRLPVCVLTPALSKKLQEEGVGPIHPLAIEGAAYLLQQPCDVLTELDKVGDSIRASQDRFLTPVPFNPKAAADAIDGMVKW